MTAGGTGNVIKPARWLVDYQRSSIPNDTALRSHRLGATGHPDLYLTLTADVCYLEIGDGVEAYSSGGFIQHESR
ncbi:MAG: hypothetical protein OEW83_03075 [Acidimicrobiia bacterium]|nr:hypothetical protein [Acidimicrobiia bacterium]